MAIIYLIKSYLLYTDYFIIYKIIYSLENIYKIKIITNYKHLH